jgi:hypothetical protein
LAASVLPAIVVSSVAGEQREHPLASPVFAIGWDLPRVMANLGHVDQGTTVRIYAHVMSHDEGARDALRALVEGETLPTEAGITALNRHQDAETLAQEVG